MYLGKNDEYTFADVKDIIEKLTNKTDEEIMEIMGGTHQCTELAETELTNLILIYATMQTFCIDKVKTIDVNNLDGLIYKRVNKLS